MEKTHTNIYSAMLKAQQAFDTVVRSDDAFNYKYAPLDKVIEATRKGLSDNGLVIMQFPINVEDHIGVKTVLAHESGETLESEYVTSKYKPDPQGIGALITYLRRYAYMAVCGIAPEDDDAASAMPSKPTGERKEYGNLEGPATDAQIQLIHTLITKTSTDKAAVLKAYNIESTRDLNKAEASKLIGQLKSKEV